MTTDTSEKGLESLIVKAMTGLPTVPVAQPGGVQRPATPYAGTGWLLGDARDYDRDYCVDLRQLRAFLEATQPKLAAALELD